ncbi:MAG: glycerol kinase [Bacteriovorax sp. MedPE-SWde]|nr:MAG: glycerol kinase [Bacteriovorax sp. MedPE-SWde]
MYILSIDQGTTGTTAVLVDAKSLQIVGKVNEEYPQIYPHPGWVEHNLEDIWNTVKNTVTKVLAVNKVSTDLIKTIGITNQRETTCAFTKDGEPLANAIVWQDRRTHDFCKDLVSKGHSEEFKKKTGLPLDPYFSGTKINWLLNNNENVMKAHEANNLLFGTIDTYLLYKLTGNISHKTDATNASRTLLMNLETSQWDKTLINILDIDKETLPTICNSIDSFGLTKNLSFLPDGISINGILGDQQSALFGQACFNKGEGKCTYGTGAFMLVNTGSEIKYSDNGLLTTVAFRHNNQTTYALEGSCYIAGACVQWLRDNLQFFESSPEIEALALKVDDLSKVRDLLLLPFFTGLGSPHWIADAKAALVGITRDTGKEEISRVALEGICFSINDLIKAMRKDMGSDLDIFKVDGGAVSNDLLMQIQSEISKIPIVRPTVIETTAYGAALAAAIGANLITMDSIRTIWKEDKKFISSNDNTNSNYFSYKEQQWDSYINKLFK